MITVLIQPHIRGSSASALGQQTAVCAVVRLIISFSVPEHMLAPFLASPRFCSAGGGESIWPFPLWIWDKREAVMVGRRQGEQRWRGSLMAVINDNGAEESRDTGAAYIIPSHHCHFSANQHTAARLVHTPTHTHECTHTHTLHLLLGSAPAEDFQVFMVTHGW